jgi:hypothetical protein
MMSIVERVGEDNTREHHAEEENHVAGEVRRRVAQVEYAWPTYRTSKRGVFVVM